MKVAVIIPAHLHSTRMHQKLLRAETGKPLILQTFDNLNWLETDDTIHARYIASDADWILNLFDPWRRLITGEHKSGTDRIAEAVAWLGPEEYDLIVNIQADEPEIQPEHIKALIEAATSMPSCDMATLAAPLRFDDRHKSNVVKVVRGIGGYATGFSRTYARNAQHHLGVYAYTPRFLKWFTSLPQSASEQREKLEQLRALDNGARIRVAIVDEAWPGIDTEEEYQAFVKRWKERQCPTTQSASA